MYDHVFFDADGTLFDFMAAEKWAISHLLTELELTADEEATDTYSRINNGVWLEFEQGLISMEMLKTERFRRFHHHYGIERDPHHSATRYAQLLGQTFHLYEDAIPVLDALFEAGMPMTLITNGISAVQRGRLEASGTAKYFTAVVISEEIGIQKPEVGYFTKAIEMATRHGAKASSPLVVGDSITSDIRGGIAASLDTCWVNRFGMRADRLSLPTYEITTLYDLMPILKR